jgi:coenzyme F420-0:L-glutamate ligase/coenzyme F420-1:gamma-L-glutamate ligase
MQIIALGGIPDIGPGDDLVSIILASLEGDGLDLRAEDIVVVAQKIVSKAEGRHVRLAEIEPSFRALEVGALSDKDPRIVELILSESRDVLRCRPGVLIVEDRRGLVLANAGIDASNVVSASGEDVVLLLPVDPDASAACLSEGLSAAAGVAVGVVINDSIGRAWRNGTVGTAIGVSGLPGLVDLRGQADLYGRTLKSTQIGLADEIAAAASIVMGQADEGQPVVLIRGAPYDRDRGAASDLLRPRANDLFR